MELNFNDYVRKPFVIQAVEVTAENIHEVSKLIGTIEERKNGSPYILVNRHLVPNVTRVEIGFWVTKMGKNIRCYSSKVFSEQFVISTPDIEAWVEFMNIKEDAIAST